MTTIATGNRRLLKLADFLEKLPSEKFDISNWASNEKFEADSWIAPNMSALEKDCGTVACALGWACIMPEFRRLGAYLDEGWNPAMKAGGVPEEEIFALNCGDGDDDLFYSHDYPETKPGPKDVAKKIRKFVASRS